MLSCCETRYVRAGGRAGWMARSYHARQLLMAVWECCSRVYVLYFVPVLLRLPCSPGLTMKSNRGTLSISNVVVRMVHRLKVTLYGKFSAHCEYLFSVARRSRVFVRCTLSARTCLTVFSCAFFAPNNNRNVGWGDRYDYEHGEGVRCARYYGERGLPRVYREWYDGRARSGCHQEDNSHGKARETRRDRWNGQVSLFRLLAVCRVLLVLFHDSEPREITRGMLWSVTLQQSKSGFWRPSREPLEKLLEHLVGCDFSVDSLFDNHLARSLARLVVDGFDLTIGRFRGCWNIWEATGLWHRWLQYVLLLCVARC